MKRNNYTGLVQDLIDRDGSPDDEVSGYTIKQIEGALRGARSWDEWKNNLKNQYYNATENKLDRLFAYWNY